MSAYAVKRLKPTRQNSQLKVRVYQYETQTVFVCLLLCLTSLLLTPFAVCMHNLPSLAVVVCHASPAMASSAPGQPQRLKDALEQHYQQLLAETQTKPSPALPSSSYATARLSPTSTSSTASDSSSSTAKSTSPPLSPLRPSKRLTALDDDSEDDSFSSSSAYSSSASSLSASSHTSTASHPIPSSRLPLPLPTARVDSLLTLCTLHVASHLDALDSLARLPEEVVQQLLYLTIMRSGMTTTLAKLFAASGHDSVVRWVEENLDLSAVYVASTHSCRDKF